MKKFFGLAPNVFFLGLVSMFNDLSSEMVYSVMPAFLTMVLGAPPVLVGLLEGFADALASFLKILSGWFSDRIGKRRVLAAIGYSLSAATRLVLSAVGNFWQVFGLRAADRVGKGFRDSPRDALISESVPSEELGRSFGYHRAMDTVGGTLGPLAAVILLPLLAGNYRNLFLVGFVLGLLALLAFVFVRDIPRDPNKPPRRVPFTLSMKEFSGNFKFYVASVFLFGLGFMPLGLVLLQSQRIGLGLISLPLMYFVYSLSFVLFAIPFGHLSDRIGERKVLLFGFLAAVAGYAALSLVDGAAGIFIGFAVIGLYSAMTEGVQKSLAGKLVAADQRATGQGFLGAAVGISSLLAGLAGGTIWTSVSPRAAFLYGIIVMSIGLIAFIFYNQKYGKTSH